MSEQKETTQETNSQSTAPLGLTANPDVKPSLEWQEFFALKQIAQGYQELITHIEQKYMSLGVLRPYFKEDLVLTGKKTKVKNAEGVESEQDEYTLNPDFWKVKQVTDIPKTKSIIIPTEEVKPSKKNSKIIQNQNQ